MKTKFQEVPYYDTIYIIIIDTKLSQSTNLAAIPILTLISGNIYISFLLSIWIQNLSFQK